MDRLLKDILTGIDNTTYDGGRVLCVVSFIIYFIMAFVSFFTEKPWTALDFASGVSAMAVGFGVHLYLKKPTEPPQNG